MSRRSLLALCVVAFGLGLVWVVSYGLPLGVSVVVLLVPVVLAVFSWLWGW